MRIHRRRLLQAAAAAAVSSATPPLAQSRSPSMSRIERIDLYPVRYPMTGFFKFFTGPHEASGRAARAKCFARINLGCFTSVVDMSAYHR